MQLFLVVVAALAVAAEGFVPITYNYHEQVGIPLAARIKAAEEAKDFDGSRIAGGIPAPLGSQPHMGGLVITLTDDRQSVCGSSLLSNTRLVTAATCWRHRTTQARLFTVVLGSQRLFSGGQRINTNQVEVHAQYSDNNFNNNIAMITITYVNFDNNINRVNLPTGNNQYVGVWATAVGFGSNGDTGISQDPGKYQVALQVISNLLCSYTYGNNVVASTLCVATPNGRSTCQGDWGGPLAIGSGVFRELIGVASFGHMVGCLRAQPTAFSRVTSYVPWIRQRL